MMNDAGMLIGLDGTTITTNPIFVITRPQPGELRVENSPSQDTLTDQDQGVYTCVIPLQSGEMRDINIGIYPSGFNSKYPYALAAYSSIDVIIFKYHTV